MKTLEGKIVIITGASSGIGEQTAKKLANNGAKVIITARRKERLDKIVDSNPDNLFAKELDVKDREAFQKIVDWTIAKFGRIDVLFNNAGIMPTAPLNEKRYDEWQNMIDINIMGVLNGIAAVLDVMRTQKFGHIITTDSVAGHVVFDGGAVYSGTKFAVRAIMDGLRIEERLSGIKSTLISPGTVNTELHMSIQNIENRQKVEKLQNEIGLRAEDVAEAVYFAINTSQNNVISEVILRPIQQRD